MTFTSLDKNKFIEIEPQSIQFEDLPKKSSIASVRIINIFSTNIVFKVKTTAPRAYVVKPNQSVLAPGDSMEVQFCMNPTETYPSVQNSKDRFMIAATDVGTLAYGYNLNSIWAEKPSSAIQQTKLAPVFVRAPTISTQENNGSLLNDHNRAVNYGQQTKSIQMSDSISSISNSLNNSAAMDEMKKTYSNKGNYVEQNNTERNNMAMTQKRNFNLDAETQSQQYNPMRNSDHNAANVSIYGSQQYNQANDRHLSKSFSAQSSGGVIASGLDYKKEYEKLLSKVEEQEKNLLKASEDRNRIYSDLSSLKENLSKRKISSIKSATPKETNTGGFQLLHLILVAVVSLLLGAFFSV